MQRLPDHAGIIDTTALHHMRILIVDDDDACILLLKGLLAKEGYDRIDAVTSGEDAMQQMHQSPPDLVLLDMLLPGINGDRVCSGIKSDETTAHIPVIMITGGALSANEALERCYGSGANDFVSKPFNHIELLARIKNSLYLKANHGRLRQEVAYHIEADRKNQELISQLKDLLKEVDQLRGCLPICSYCKKIRDDEGYWNQLEKYITEHSNAFFTHGLCPECCTEHFGDLKNKPHIS